MGTDAFDEAKFRAAWNTSIGQITEALSVNTFKKASFEIKGNQVKVFFENSFAKEHSEKHQQNLGVSLRKALNNRLLQLIFEIQTASEVKSFDKIESIGKTFPIILDYKRIFDLEIR